MSTQTAGFHTDVHEWAEAQFGQCELGDARRSARAVAVAAIMASNPSVSPNEACKGDEAAKEGLYRFLRNDSIEPKALDEGPCQYTAEQCRDRTILAVQDTSTLSFPHEVRHLLGELGGTRGFVVHSVLALDAETREILGLLDQQRWSRPDVRPGKKQRKKLSYEEKESYKWEQASQNIHKRLDRGVAVIEVADREADIYEYLKRSGEQSDPRRYVVRAFHPRKLVTSGESLKQYMEKMPVLGSYEVHIDQRGPMPGEFNRAGRASRPASDVQMEVRCAEVALKAPGKSRDVPLTVNAIYVREQGVSGKEATEWLLLTSEPISSFQEVRKVISYYESRWLIEEYHKAWKSGCKIEASRLQSPGNLERLAVITSHIAVRLLQLRFLSQKTPDAPCDVFLDKDEWQCLHATTNPRKPLPDSPPSFRWAILTIAKLGGWNDTKRTGRIGWAAMWKGWFRFQERVLAWRLATHGTG